MADLQVSKSINVPALKAWEKLSAFSGLDEYSPVEICTVVGEGVGAKRMCYMPNGAVIYEVLEKLESEAMELQYRITVAPFPIKNYVSNIRVEKIAEERCQIHWGCCYDVKPSHREEMEELFSGLFATIIDQLEIYLLTKINEPSPI